MKNEPTNGELAIMIDNLNQNINRLHIKADITNGKVIANTEYRLKQTGAMVLVKWVGGGNLVAIIILYIKDLIL